MQKKIYLVKKDPQAPCGKDNWIIMNGRQFRQFLDSPQSEGRRNSFAQMDACSEGDYAIVMETEGESLRSMRAEHDRNTYMRKTAEEAAAAGIIALMPPEEADRSGNGYPEDPVADAAEADMEIELLRSSVGRLREDEQRLIRYCLLSEMPLSEREYGSRYGMCRDSVHAAKRRIVRKLAGMLGENGLI